MKHDTNPSRQHRPDQWARLKQQLKQSDLTPSQVGALLALIDTTEKRQRVLSDLCTLREHIEPLFVYGDSPYLGDHSHPLCKILITANEIIGVLLKHNERLAIKELRGGKVVGVRSTAPTAPTTAPKNEG